MGYSIGFVRSWLALWALVALVGLALGGVNELLGLGLFTGGYPVLGTTGTGYGSFALQASIVFAVAAALSALVALLERR